MNRRNILALALFGIANAVMTKVAKARNATKPMVFGRCVNVPVYAKDDVDLVFQACGKCDAFTAVRDGGAEIIIDGDDASLADLVRAPIPPGHARTCVAEGTIRLGCAPVYPVTVDVIGEARSAVSRLDELCGAVRDGEMSRSWLVEVESQGLLVRTF